MRTSRHPLSHIVKRSWTRGEGGSPVGSTGGCLMESKSSTEEKAETTCCRGKSKYWSSNGKKGGLKVSGICSFGHD